MKHGLILCFLALSIHVLSQDSKEKTLLVQLESTSADSTRIRLLKELSISTSKHNNDLSRQYANECLLLSQKTGNKNGQAQAYNLLGNSFFIQAEFVEALEHYLKALRLFSDLDDRKSMAIVYTNIGTINLKQGNLIEARSNLELAVQLKEKYALHKGLSNSYLSLASVVYTEGDLNQALILFNKGRQLAHENKEVKIEAACLNGIGAIQYKKTNYQAAVDGYQTALNLFHSFDGDNRKMITAALHNLAGAHRKLGHFEETYKLLNQSLSLAKEIQSNEDIKQAYAEFKEYYKDKGEYEKALMAEEQHAHYKDRLFNEKTLQVVQEMQEKYKAADRKKEITKLQESNTELKEKSALRNSLLIVSTVAFFLILLVILFYFKQLKAKQQRKQSELEQKALRAQMNPHFLFNSLNSIQRMYIEGDEDMANDYMADFSRLLRNILENSGKDLIRLKEELDVIHLYMELELVRTRSSFTFTCEIADDIQPIQLKIPPLILQPYLENAIWHGIMSKKERGYIQLNISRLDNEKLQCQITDNGIGFYTAQKTNSAKENKSKGMQITAERLGGKQHVLIEEIPSGGTRITLNIPYTT